MEYILISLTIVISLIFSEFIKRYLRKKGENLATKQDISSITNKIEEVKSDYTKLVEEHKHELKKNYDLLKPSLDFSIELDKTLIEKISSLNNTVFRITRLQQSNLAPIFQGDMMNLVSFLIEYKVRYKNLKEGQEIIDMYNEFGELQDKFDDEKFKLLFLKLEDNLDKLMLYFIEPVKGQNNC